jgi:predicted permease
MIDDLRFTLRSWAKTPAFAIVAILTLALGLAAATVIFSVVDSVLLRPLPYPSPDRIVDVREVDEQGHSMRVAEPNFADLHDRSRSFEALAKYAQDVQAVTGGNEAVRANVCAVSGQFFRVLGVQPFIGRTLTDDASSRGVVVSLGFWNKVLGGRRDLEGIFVRFGNETFPVIGVLPDGLGFPLDTEIWCPASIYPPNASRTAHNWDVVARLQPGVSPGQANAELSQIGRDLKREHSNNIDAAGFTAAPVRDRMVKDVRAILLVLCGAVGLLLFIAVFNVTNLVLVRTTLRRREIALRIALGASRARLFRQFLSEALFLTFAGGALGVAAARWSLDLMVGLYHGSLPRFDSAFLNLPLLLCSLGIWIILATVLASVPFWSGRLRTRQEHLQNPGRAQSASRSETGTRSGLVMAQIGLTLALLIGAALLGRSLQRLLSLQPGFNPESTVAMVVSKPDPADSGAARQLALFHSDLMDRLGRIPGITATGGVESLPLTGGAANGTFLIEESGKSAQTMDELVKEFPAAIAAGRSGDAIFHIASGSYFKVMQIPLIRGRYLTRLMASTMRTWL